ncbi:MAG: VPLPA-CTERM sorting domain-containing protein [Desulfobacter sp.]|nr:MAG: VPLPA-CTERM sorting domain-containing protein [Desulfobacter sp.]
MKTKALFTAIMLTMVLSFSGNALAALSFYITSDYALGNENLTFTLKMETDAPLTVAGGYNFEFEYDNTELIFDSLVLTPPNGLYSSLFGPFNYDESNGTINNVTMGLFMGMPPTTLEADIYDIGTFTFNVRNDAAVANGETDFNFDFEDSMFPNSTKQYCDAFLLDVSSASPVPVPSAVWLLGTGLLGLAGIRRKRA